MHIPIVEGGEVRIRYVCPSTICRCEVEIEIDADSSHGIPAPTCACGVALKKVYTPPGFRKLTEAEATRIFGPLGGMKEGAKKAAGGL